MPFLILIAGLALLVFGGDALVRGAVSVAQRLHVPPIIIGLTVVAFGTSAPELVVALDAALHDAPGISVGSIVGSNINNVLLVLGVPALITPLVLAEVGLKRSTIFMIVIELLLVWLVWDGILTRIDGLILFVFLIGYLAYSGYVAMRTRAVHLAQATLDEIEPAPRNTIKVIGLIALGILGLGVGGKMTTEGALAIAHLWGVDNTAVGLTIVALGTSLPELAATVSASLRRQSGVAIGNVIGSNIFNTLGVLGITPVLVPLTVPEMMLDFDIWIMLAVALVLVPFAFVTRRIGRVAAVFMLLGYVGYIGAVFAGYAQ